MSELENYNCIANFILPTKTRAQNDADFAKEYKDYLEMLTTRAGNQGSFISYVNQSDAMCMFLAMHNRPAVIETFDFWVPETGPDFARFIEDLLSDVQDTLAKSSFYLTTLTGRTYLIRNEYNLVGYLSINQMTSEKNIIFSGDPAFSKILFDFIKSRVSLQLPMSVKRLDGSGQNVVTQIKRIKDKKPIADFAAFFPCLDRTPAEIMEAFSASDANVLFIYGAAGLGKTQFIREMVRAKKGKGDVFMADTFEVFKHPGLVPYIHNMKDGSWFITEDSTDMIQKRDDGNSLMAGILNATEGLSSGNVKFVISTNIDHLREVDSALIRPGRTFAAYHFTALTAKQGVAARAAIGLPSIDFDNQSKVTLAEALNWEEYQALKAQQTKVGF